jgi:O-succinylhomoserine sulfhydrylase
VEGNVYARFTNPTVTAMQQRLAALEGAEACGDRVRHGGDPVDGDGALSAGDHVVASRGLFGATQQLFGNILSRFGIETTFVPATDLAAYKAAVTPKTKLFFVESPSNPLTELVDIAAWRPSPTKPAPCWRSITASARRRCSSR